MRQRKNWKKLYLRMGRDGTSTFHDRAFPKNLLSLSLSAQSPSLILCSDRLPAYSVPEAGFLWNGGRCKATRSTVVFALLKPRPEEPDGVRDDEDFAGAVFRRIGNKAFTGKLMEAPGSILESNSMSVSPATSLQQVQCRITASVG